MKVKSGRLLSRLSKSKIWWMRARSVLSVWEEQALIEINEQEHVCKTRCFTTSAIAHPAVPQRARSRSVMHRPKRPPKEKTHKTRCTNRVRCSSILCQALVGHRCSLLCDAILHFCNVCSVKRSADATRLQRDSRV